MEDMRTLESEELEQVSGGMEDLGNGKVSLKKGDCFLSKAVENRGYIVLKDQTVERYDIVQVGVVDVKKKEKQGWAQYQYKFLKEDCSYSEENAMPDFSLYD